MFKSRLSFEAFFGTRLLQIQTIETRSKTLFIIHFILINDNSANAISKKKKKKKKKRN